MNHFDEEEEWNLMGSFVLLTQCEQCREEKPCKLEEDPYLATIEPEAYNSEEYWCKVCYDKRIGDI